MRVPLVSIVTPTLNPGDRLVRCLESLARQTYPLIEHLIIDGGSSDGTVDLLRSTKGIEWISERDEGQSSAINKGLMKANGEYVGWLNADDVLYPDAVANVVDVFSRRPDVVQVFGRVEIVEEGGGLIRRPCNPARERSWLARNIAAQPGSFTVSSALEEVGGLDESLHYMMDLDLWVRLLDSGGKFGRTDQLVARFEVHPDSKSGSVSHAEFVREEAFVRLRSDRVSSGSAAVGRAACLRAADARELSERRVEQELEALLEDPLFGGMEIRRDDALAGATIELALSLVKSRHINSVFRFLDRRIWTSAPARRRLMDSILRAIARLHYRLVKP